MLRKADAWVFSSALALAVPTADVSAQTWEVFDMTSAGLPSNNVTDIVEDSQGVIWAATEWGLCRYDGSTWSVYQEGSSGIPGNVVRALAVDSLDRIWIGTQLFGVVVFDGTDWVTYDTENSGLPENEINSLAIDHRGWAWIGTYLGLACFTGDEWRVYNTSDTAYGGLQFNGNTILHTAVREDGLVAVGTLNGGFHYLTDTSLVVHATYIDMFPDNTQNETAFDPLTNERWLATPSQGLLRQGGHWWDGPWFQYTTGNSTIPSNAVTCLRVDGQSRVWVGTLLGGVGVRETDGAFVNYTSSNSGLPDNTVQCLLIATDGSIWVGTASGGLARLTFAEGLSDAPEQDAAIYPNPCPGRLTLELPWKDGGEWYLFGSQGTLTRRGVLPEAARTTLDLTGLDAGVYTLAVPAGSRSLTWKVILLP